MRFEKIIVTNNYICTTASAATDALRGGVMAGNLMHNVNVDNCLVYGNTAVNTGMEMPESTGYNLALFGNFPSPKDTTTNTIKNSIVLGATPFTQYNFGYAAYQHNHPFENVYTDTYPTDNYYYSTEWKLVENFKHVGVTEVTATTGEAIYNAIGASLDRIGTWIAAKDGIPTLRLFHAGFVVTDNGDGTHSETCNCGLTSVGMAHDWSAKDGHCTVCGAECQHGVDGTGKDALEFVKTKDGDCETPAQGHFRCTICGNETTDLVDDPAGAPGHTFKTIPAVPHSGCTVDGNIEYKVCEVCHKFFNTNEVEITEEDTIDHAPGHTYDNQCDKFCNVCNEEREVPDHVYGEDDKCIYCGAAKYTLGDVNDDGEISTVDLGILMQYITQWGVEINLDAADVNGDGTVDTQDYGLLMQFVNQWDVTLG